MLIKTDMQKLKSSPEYYDITPEGQKAIEKKDWKTLLKNVKFCAPGFDQNIVTLEEGILTELKSKEVGRIEGGPYGISIPYEYDKINKPDFFQHIKVKDLGDDLTAIAWLDCVEASMKEFGNTAQEQRADGFIIDTKNKQIVRRLHDNFVTVKGHYNSLFFGSKIHDDGIFSYLNPSDEVSPQKRGYNSGVYLDWDPKSRQITTGWLDKKKKVCQKTNFYIPTREKFQSELNDIMFKKGIAFNDYDLIKESLEAGASPNIMIFECESSPHPLCDYTTALHRFVKQRKSERSPQKELKIVDLLLRHGAPLNDHDCRVYEPDGPDDKPEYNGGRWIEDTTVLTQAVVNNDLEMVKLLINHGAVPSEKDLKCAEKHCPRDHGWAITKGNVMYELLQNTIKKIKRDEKIKEQSSQRKEQRQELAQMPKGKRKKSTLMKTLQEGSYERNEKANELKQARQERDFKAKEEIRLKKEKAFKAHVGLLKQRKKADKKRTGVVKVLDRLNTLPADDIRKKLKKMVVDNYHKSQPQKDIADTPPKVEQEKPVMDTPPKVKTEKPQTNKKTQQKGIMSRLFGGGRK